GTYPLPEAQLDRFLFKIQIDYPTEEQELTLVKQVTTAKVGECLDVSAIEPVVEADEVLRLQQLVAQIHVDERIYDYAINMTHHTRSWPGITVGAGPRGSIALIRAARAAALIAQRDFVIPDDVKTVALATLRHRISLAPELEIEGRDVDSVLTGILEKIAAPRT
ncbi:MAG: MoxR family ATPase, partial [Pseudomonadota bacterium]|nr:MoxR family ATPase [Pseudomonadota bacterium]